MGNKHWFVIFLISVAPSDGIILSPTGCSLIWGGRRVRGGESGETSGCKHSYPWLHWVKLKTEVSWYEWCASEIVTSPVICVSVFIMRHRWAIFPSRNHHSVVRRSQITARCLNPSRVNIAFKERMNIWSAARDKSLIRLAAKLLHLVLSASSIYLSVYH